MRRPSLSRFFLRTGLGIVFLWIGLDVFRHPDAWIGFAPPQGTLGLDRLALLKAGGAFDIAVGVSLLLGAFPRITALLAAFHLAGVLVTQGLNAILIRDVGLLGAALSLFFWKKKRAYHHRGLLRRLFRRRAPAPEV